jgi:hypothetical protein
MSTNIRLPNINAKTEAGQLLQVKSYLLQLAEQLNFALQDVESKAAANTPKNAASSPTSNTEKEAQSAFTTIKALIIKSADIVDAYYDEINKRLEGVYVAESDFGVYAEQTSQDIQANSTSIASLYTNIQTIITDVERLVKANAYIKSGLLYEDAGVPVYGLEIGQSNEIDGVEVFNKFARFTADKLSFYDSNDNEVAYVSDRKLYITIVEVTGEFIMGGFVDIILPDKSVVTKWVVEGG